MPGLTQRSNQQFCNGTASFQASNESGFWSKHRDAISYNQLQKFWSDLSPKARQQLLRIDKQTFFEQARKNMYCSRCNGLLLEGFLQIVMYGKSLQQEGANGYHSCRKSGDLKNQCDDELCVSNACESDVQDPSVHPWGGLMTTRDGALTLLDCYICTKSLKALQNVFDSARARERERELLYPDACGGGGRGWISQAMAGYGRGHGTRETCALHTARLSVDTLVDFWSALGDETRQSLLRMKEEDFIERLMYRFDSKRFCRDCRRNVIREFKELKELKRMRREPQCTSWFCVADTAFQYEVSHDTVQADWHQTFVDSFGTYHHFEWAIGTGEGKSDILDFENVGLSGRVQVNGLDLSGLNACYITLRAWKRDGRCTELSVKAHALKGKRCVHCRLVVGDGFVTITRGESIRRFFEHAEETEEEEDDESLDKDGNELDGECSRPQKHAKSPELAREFLLDAATVIFKEQVEKAFREGTARQNAHSIFVCLALKLLEERVHVACKEIITLEKQMKLLEEEEKEKREEEERKERRRIKEKEKKLRRKERLRGKEKDRESKCSESNPPIPDDSREESIPDKDSSFESTRDSVSETDEGIPSRPLSPDTHDVSLTEHGHPNSENGFSGSPDDYLSYTTTGDGFEMDHLSYSRRKKITEEFQFDAYSKWSERRQSPIVSECAGLGGKSEPRHRGDNFNASRSTVGLTKQSIRNAVKTKFGERFHCSSNRMSGRHDYHACSCNQHSENRGKIDQHMSGVTRETKFSGKSESLSDIGRPHYRGNRYNPVENVSENSGRPKSKIMTTINYSNRDSPITKKVWEPMESQKYPRSNSDSDVTLRSKKVEASETRKLPDLCGANSSDESCKVSIEINDEKEICELRKSSYEARNNCQNGFCLVAKSPESLKEVIDEAADLCLTTQSSLHGISDSSMSSSSNSDNCSSCLSEGDTITSSSNTRNSESSSTSDSEDGSHNLEESESPLSLQNGKAQHLDVGTEKKQDKDGGENAKSLAPECAGTNPTGNLHTQASPEYYNRRVNVNPDAQPQGALPSLNNQNLPFSMLQAPAMGYYYQSPLSWAAPPANGLMSFTHSDPYLYTSPFGYGVNENPHFMQYGALQHMTPPIYNPPHFPVYQPVPQSNCINSKENAKIHTLDGMKDASHEVKLQNTASTLQHAHEAKRTAATEQSGKFNKSDGADSGFSLFHFGGPVALPTGFKSDPTTIKEGYLTSPPSNSSAERPGNDHGCNKNDSIEEYNLFSASNGIKFTFF